MLDILFEITYQKLASIIFSVSQCDESVPDPSLIVQIDF